MLRKNSEPSLKSASVLWERTALADLQTLARGIEPQILEIRPHKTKSRLTRLDRLLIVITKRIKTLCRC